ncbi:MAG TPA: hypothetical protein VJO32_12535 [Ktedonobacteraceae bacterium]|nr:hypothetical protein [Ktedonobacteraceae bacterium]
MQSTQWFSLVNFHSLALAEKLELLLAQREKLSEQQRELLERQAELERQKQQLLARRTVHELQCHLFWLKLRNSALAKQEDEAFSHTGTGEEQGRLAWVAISEQAEKNRSAKNVLLENEPYANSSTPCFP